MSTRLKGWIAAGLKEADRVEQAMQEIRDGLWLRTAVGVNLDMLGRVYNVQRKGREDAEYRLDIQLQAATVVNGTPDEILVFLQLIYEVTGVEYVPEYPAGFFIAGPLVPTVDQLQRISPAGVSAFPGEYMTTIEGEYVTTIEGERMLSIVIDTRSAALADALDTALDIYADSLDPTAEIIADTLEF